MDIFNNLPHVMKSFAGLTLLNEGTKLQVEGAKAEARAYDMAGTASIAAANYNIAIDQLNTNRQLDQLNKQVYSVLSKNRATMGASGLSLASGSFLAASSRILSNAERDRLFIKNTAQQRQQMIDYEGRVAETQYRNQAAAARYQASAAKRAGRRDMIANVGQALGQFFSSY